MDESCGSGMTTPEMKQSDSSHVEAIVGSLISEARVLENRLAKIDSKFTGLNKLECIKEDKCEENIPGYFPRLIRALGYLGKNLEAIRQQVNELDKI